jgi:hypothetical protein
VLLEYQTSEDRLETKEQREQPNKGRLVKMWFPLTSKRPLCRINFWRNLLVLTCSTYGVVVREAFAAIMLKRNK